ncbi:MAG TPA: aminotransferase class I/II-fold pyridoxal phosphate-dependent enzyme [Chloroflexota bacterium]|nr:aminotransferase class I/II-fold pyridoxal phosphate-dependent enzyme [Chloroflexota bacterium]HUM67631.1 aminotransferase class I/II-fold pyridoxal phosphate-dependent enzyme [Chloroflexota bacterium]
MTDLQAYQEQYDAYQRMGLKLNMQRGQPSDADFDLSNEMLTIVNEDTLVTPGGIDIRNYPGGVAGLPEARALFATVLDAQPDEMVVWNNASLELMANTLMWAMLRGLKDSLQPWAAEKPKMIVTVPGYDRHFFLLEKLGIEMMAVEMTPDGPDINAIERLAKSDPTIKGIFFVPTYSNPTGETISDEVAQRLAGMDTAVPDFTIFADDAYRVHHLTDDYPTPPNLLRLCAAAGHPDRVYVYGSTSKMTFAGAGVGFMATSVANVKYITGLMGAQSIGPNKVEQYRHVRFLQLYPGGIPGLMRDHANLLRPKFEAVYRVLSQELGDSGLATWAEPKGGYFVSLDTARPVADRVVALANAAGVSLTPAGATYPYGRDPHNRNIRLAPSRPPVAEVEQAMTVVAACIKLASAEYEERNS